VQDSEGAVDLAAVLERIGGDEDLLRELVGLYLDDEPQLIDQIGAAIDAGDAPAVGRLAHTLKGAVSNFCARRAHATAQAMEDAGRDNRLDAAAGLFPSLRAEFALVREALAPYRASR
jgi:HPt (histidine-containing phosphotransfer) domain-containing protein